MRHLTLPLLLVALLLGGCAAPLTRDEPPTRPAEPRADPVPPADAPAPGHPSVVEPAPGTTGAVLGLLQRANNAVIAGDLRTADALLERALRIEPSNAVVWHYLARVRFVQGHPEQAVAAASKSNALAGDNRAVIASNWRIIAEARRRQGDADGARTAAERAAAVAP
ncbi:tetratricopeptide repeat protein [Ectothiorhodospiraceae bacterium 2226]|nr:tetratricopeptide repeat protein [Ectothiorhodospiraceae bacterium 2226]